jgi:hypothetical protein
MHIKKGSQVRSRDSVSMAVDRGLIGFVLEFSLDGKQAKINWLTRPAAWQRMQDIELDTGVR